MYDGVVSEQIHESVVVLGEIDVAQPQSQFLDWYAAKTHSNKEIL